MRRIRIIATGGTIASQDNGNGLRPTMGPETIVNLAFSEDDEFSTSIRRMVDSGELCFDIKEIMSVDSSDMRPELWNRIGEEIDRCVGERYDGVIILHGTDTMAYTAGALSVMFKNLPIPVILTGSQLPIEAEGTDAKDNLRDAVKALLLMADERNIDSNIQKSIYIAFGGRLIDGRYAIKMDTDRFDAFRAVDSLHETKLNSSDFKMNEEYGSDPAGAGDPTGHEEDNRYTKRDSDNNYSYTEFSTSKVQLIKVHPGLSPDMLEAMLSCNLDAVLLELYGAGGFPSLYDSLLPVIGDAVGRGTKIYAISQCMYRKTDLTRYEVGRKLLDAGVISLGSYSTEYALAYIMMNYSKA
ncbi:MAG TPA: hypothetical protein DEO87_01520 [Lachnospiraceae bacterium]|nr:hypothetical protein [Lachnospiraceae bacterium]